MTAYVFFVRTDSISVIWRLSSFDWWRKNPDAPPYIIAGTGEHLGRTTDLLQARWIASSLERFESLVRFEPTEVRGK